MKHRLCSFHYFLFRLVAFTSVISLMGISTSLQAQQPKQPTGTQSQASEVIEDSMRIKDGLRMKYRYYPGPASKSTVPIIMLHGFQGQGGEFERLAKFLRSSEGGGHSVFVPDLRGHGDSRLVQPPNSEKEIKLSPARLRKTDLATTVNLDMESIKRFLRAEHAKEALNIEGLTLVAADTGCLIAMNWAARDWSWPRLAGVKQGQDVKAIVLLSPVQTFKGITSKEPLRQPDLRSRVAFLMYFGNEDNKASTSVRRIKATLAKSRIHPNSKSNHDKTLFAEGLSTSLQGTDLLNAQLPTQKGIKKFIDDLVVSQMKEHFPWKPRNNPLD